MAEIAPSIMATNPKAYTQQIEHVSGVAKRLHIDLADGIFAPNQTVRPSEVWWPAGIKADIHVMYKRPVEILDALIALKPHQVTLHAESEGDFITIAKTLHYHGIEAGVALLPRTPVSYIASAIDLIDHVLVFGGNLGHYSHQPDMNQLIKAKQIRALNKQVEIGWDGGVNDKYVAEIAGAGVEVIVSGSFLQKARSAQEAYDTLKALAQ